MRKKPFSLQKTDRKLAILVDPDNHTEEALVDFATDIQKLNPDFLFLGGSLIYKSSVAQSARILRSIIDAPIVLFPGHFTQLTDEVDVVLLLSLISGRNPDLLIGQHVLAAPKLKSMKAEKISTGYMLIDGGHPTSVSYMSHTQPIPRDKGDIALCTAQAGELLGMQLIYMDAGSGASNATPIQMVNQVAQGTDIPLIIGGGIRSLKQINDYWDAGANLVVVGNVLEENSNALASFSKSDHANPKEGY